jgi:anti-sigma B factor antagonist
VDELELTSEPEMSFNVGEDDAGDPVVTITGELDMSSVETIQQGVAPVLARNPSRLVVDVSGLRFADSSAIALWVRWATSVREFELREPPPLLRRVIAGMGLSEILVVKP